MNAIYFIIAGGIIVSVILIRFCFFCFCKSTESQNPVAYRSPRNVVVTDFGDSHNQTRWKNLDDRGLGEYKDNDHGGGGDSCDVSRYPGDNGLIGFEGLFIGTGDDVGKCDGGGNISGAGCDSGGGGGDTSGGGCDSGGGGDSGGGCDSGGGGDSGGCD